MRYLFILLLFPCMVYSATNNETFTVGSGGDHVDLATAESTHEQDLVTNDSSLTFEIIGGSWTNQSYTIIDGYTTDATHFLTITTTGDARHDGVWDGTNAYRIVNDGVCLQIKDDFTVIDGLQVLTNGTGDWAYGLYVRSKGITIKNCIVKNTNTASTGIYGIYGYIDGSVTSPLYFYNNIVYGFNNYGIVADIRTDDAAYIYNNTVCDCAIGIASGYYDVIMINNIIYDCHPNTSGNFSITTPPSYNATDSSALVGSNNQVSISDPFKDYNNDDFHLASSTSDCAEDGTSLSGTFTDDIDGDSRPQSTNWDIGADEYTSSSSPLYIKKVHLKKMGL